MKFTIGFNQDFMGMMRLVEEYKENIGEMYFPIPNARLGTSRFGFAQHPKYPQMAKKIIMKCGKLGIKSCLLINSTCEGRYIADKEHMDKVVDYLLNLRKIGLDAVQAANPLYAILIRKRIPEIEIQSSVNCYCKSLEDAKYLKMLGFDVITIDRDINRDLSLIKAIKHETGLRIKILLNEGCLLNCPFRKVHFNQIAHSWLLGGGCDVEASYYFPRMACVPLIEKHPEIIFKMPYVRPEDLKHYVDSCDIFKLATRNLFTSLVEIGLNAYIEGRFEENLVPLLESQGLLHIIKRIQNPKLDEFNFFRRVTTCNKNCEGCDYCTMLVKETAELWPKKIDYEKRVPSKPKQLFEWVYNRKPTRADRNNPIMKTSISLWTRLLHLKHPTLHS